MIPPRRGETVTVLRPGAPTRDAYGNDVAGPDVATDIPYCVIAPRSSTERMQNQDLVIAGITVYAPPGSDIQSTDRMAVRGIIYQVDGVPGDYYSPWTGEDGPVQAALTRVTG